jgi:Anti-sigma-K factor rskA/Sigma-70, region 4
VPTFDQLPAEQRAIIELVVRRGRSYQALSEALGIPTPRVRELAREALTDLAPVTAERVDPERRAQIADYVLGQQTGGEDAATRAHLRRSEAARAWTLSLIDSLDDMYEDGTRPEAPAAAAVEEAPRERERARTRERIRERRARAEAEPAEAEPAAPPAEPAPRAREALAPEAVAAVRRRRLIAGGLALIALAGLIVGIISIAGGSSKKHQPPTTGPTRLIGEQLKPLGGTNAQGLAVIAQRATQRIVVVQAKLPPTKKGQAYEVWLYNSPSDAQSIGAQVTDAQGNYQGQGPLPASVSRFKYIDVSLETIPDAACQRNPACLRKTARHNGHSVLRGLISAMRPLSAGAGAGGAGGAGTGATPGTPTVPGGGATPTVPGGGATTGP